MKTSIPIKAQAHKLQPTSPVHVIVLAFIYTALLMMSFFIISMNPHEIPYSSYFIALAVLSFALSFFIATLLYNGISVIDEKHNLDFIIKFRKPGFLNWKLIGEFMVGAEGPGGIILAVLLWAAIGIVVICIYYIFWPLVIGIMVLFGYLVYFVFFRMLKGIFAITERGKGSLTNSIGIGLIYTVLYNIFLLVIGLIVFGIISN